MEIFCFVVFLVLLIGEIKLTVVPDYVPGKWVKKFEDTFDSESIFNENWDKITSRPPNADLVPRRFSRIAPGLSYYLPRNVELKEGNLLIAVKKEDYIAINENDRIYQYSGGCVRLKKYIKYGYINVKAKLPWVIAGGMYSVYLKGENSGQINIMEAINEKTFYSHETKVREDLKDYSWLFQGTNGFTNSDFFPYHAHDWNNFGVHWAKQNVTFYINGVCASFEVLKLTDTMTLKKEAPFPVDDALHLEICNGAGNWGGKPTSDSEFPYELLVESVQVYQDEENNERDFGGDKAERDQAKSEQEKTQSNDGSSSKSGESGNSSESRNSSNSRESGSSSESENSSNSGDSGSSSKSGNSSNSGESGSSSEGQNRRFLKFLESKN